MELNLRIVKLFDLTGLESTEFADLASICSNYLSALGDNAVSDGAPIAKKVVNMWERAMTYGGAVSPEERQEVEENVEAGPEWHPVTAEEAAALLRNHRSRMNDEGEEMEPPL